jgi:CHAT domain-containing protein
MPFHAAGVHFPGSREKVFSRAVSSYTPSIKALEYAQRRARATAGAQGSLLMVTMPTTPGVSQDACKLSDLPGVAEEERRVTEIPSGYMLVELMDSPDVDHVLNRMQSCYIAHFACHGWTDHADPFNNGLLLQKRGEGNEAEQDRLTVHKILGVNLEHARIAYVSACSVARTRQRGCRTK